MIYDVNQRRVIDINKLKQALERLKCDIHVLQLSKKLNRENSTINDGTAEGEESMQQQEMSTDSDRMLTD